MTNEVDNTVRQQGWPQDQWHPVYESVSEWLDQEAPTRTKAKKHNRPRYRVKREAPDGQ